MSAISSYSVHLNMLFLDNFGGYEFNIKQIMLTVKINWDYLHHK